MSPRADRLPAGPRRASKGPPGTPWRNASTIGMLGELSTSPVILPALAPSQEDSP